MEQFYRKYEEKLNEGSVISHNQFCRIWSKAKNLQGYGVIKYQSPIDHSWKTTNVHRLSFVVFNRKSFQDINNMEISHLCHNKLCILKEHLCIETHAENRERDICVNRSLCKNHGNRPDCLLKFKL